MPRRKPTASIATHERIDHGATELLGLLDGEGMQRVVLVHDSLIAQVIRGPTYLPIRSSLDAALSSGQIELIRSSDVQRLLAGWSQLAAEALEEEADGRDFVGDALLPYLYANTDLTTALRTYGSPRTAQRQRL